MVQTTAYNVLVRTAVVVNDSN